MQNVIRVIIVMALLAVCATDASAGHGMLRNRKRTPEAGIAAAVANVVFIPVRLGVSLVAGELGGMVGFLTAGNRNAAEDVWYQFRGQNIITPEMASGHETLEFGSLEFRAEPRQ